jgi:hypothetical protein
MSEELKKALVLFLFWPLRAILWALMGLVDVLGPQGLAEPASMYLPAWAAWGLFGLSVTLVLGLFYGVALAILWWIERRQARKASA